MLPAWQDDDDLGLTVDVMAGASRMRKLRRDRTEHRLAGEEYEARLRAQFEATQPSTSWAALPKKRKSKKQRSRDEDTIRAVDPDDLDSDDSDDSDATLERKVEAQLRHGSSSILCASTSLPAKELSVKRTTDLNAAGISSSSVSTVDWHPNAQLALTSGFDKTVRLFRIDGQRNTLIQSVHLPRLPVQSAVFSADGAHVLACGRSRQWAAFDMHAGRAVMLPGVIGREEAGFRELLPSPDGKNLCMISESGALLLLSAKTKQLIGTLHASQATVKYGGCQSAAFTADGGLLFAAGASGSVQVWDVARRCCVHTWRDQGGVRCTRLAVSPSSNRLAVGSDSGAVNLYETASVLSSSDPSPIKEFLNIRTAITQLGFNSTSEMLAFSSKYVKNSLRIAHVDRRRVFANWPTSKTPLHYVQCAAFSPNSGYLSFGNDKGHALLYRVNHYARA